MVEVMVVEKPCPKCGHSWDVHDIAYFGPESTGLYCSTCVKTCHFGEGPAR